MCASRSAYRHCPCGLGVRLDYWLTVYVSPKRDIHAPTGRVFRDAHSSVTPWLYRRWLALVAACEALLGANERRGAAIVPVREVSHWIPRCRECSCYQQALRARRAWLTARC